MDATTASIDYRALAEQLLLPHRGEINPVIAGYREILLNGLEGTVAEADRKRIVVVGAGIAGMLVAKLLHGYGHDVTVIEANDDRVGGRIKTFGQPGTDSPFVNAKQYGEAGAMRFPLDLHPLLKAYIEMYELETQEFYIADVNPELDVDPKDKRYNAWLRTNSFQQKRHAYNADPKETNERFTKDGVFPDLTKTAGQLLDAAFDTAREYISDRVGDEWVNKPYDEWLEGWATIIQDFDQHTLLRYLREVAGLEQTTIDLIGTIENLTSRLPLSFMHSVLGRTDINPKNKYYELVGGSWQLTEALYADLKESAVPVLLNHRMTHIDYVASDGTRSNHTDEHDISIRVVTENEEELPDVTADLAVITIPFSSLRFVRVEPDFSYGKRRAIMELHYDAATKVLLEFSQRWWEWDLARWEEELKKLGKWEEYKEELDRCPPTEAIGGGSITDNPNRFLFYPSHPVEGSDGGVILASYTWADDARRWDSMEDKTRYWFALRGLRLIHGDRIELFSTDGLATQSWARNPYAFGEAAVFQAGQLSTLHSSIPTPEGNVHFAGEHTSLKHAWVEGSLESAIRVAIEISAAPEENR